MNKKKFASVISLATTEHLIISVNVFLNTVQQLIAQVLVLIAFKNTKFRTENVSVDPNCIEYAYLDSSRKIWSSWVNNWKKICKCYKFGFYLNECMKFV